MRGIYEKIKLTQNSYEMLAFMEELTISSFL
jgi:hypothetical protein